MIFRAVVREQKADNFGSGASTSIHLNNIDRHYAHYISITLMLL